MQITKRTQRKASIAAISGIVVIGAASLFFKTFPHLNPFSSDSSVTDKTEEATETTEETEETEETEASEPTPEEKVADATEESAVLVPDYSKLSYEELTNVLKDKSIDYPENATLEELIELTKSI